MTKIALSGSSTSIHNLHLPSLFNQFCESDPNFLKNFNLNFFFFSRILPARMVGTMMRSFQPSDDRLVAGIASPDGAIQHCEPRRSSESDWTGGERGLTLRQSRLMVVYCLTKNEKKQQQNCFKYTRPIWPTKNLGLAPGPETRLLLFFAAYFLFFFFFLEQDNCFSVLDHHL